MNICKAETHTAVDLPEDMAALLPEIAASLEDEERLLSLSSRFRAENGFPCAPHCYSRTILLREDSGTEIMVARWDQGAMTPIHGHPRISFVYVLKGRLQMEHYRDTDQGLVLTETLVKGKGQHVYATGIAGRYDNAIHRVTALSPSLSLHVYSDDALKGKAFS